MKNRKEKERKKSWDQVFKQKEVLCWDWTGALVYICILVTSTTTGHDGSVVSALASQAKGRGSILSYGTSFFSHKYFQSTRSNLRWESNWTEDPPIWSDFVQLSSITVNVEFNLTQYLSPQNSEVLATPVRYDLKKNGLEWPDRRIRLCK